jgi:hypothetical protein
VVGGRLSAGFVAPAAGVVAPAEGGFHVA